MSTTNIQPALSTTHWHLGLAYDAAFRLPVADSSIDDPVNDTGFAAQRGDLHLPMSLLVCSV
jgi:hypothetical protein